MAENEVLKPIGPYIGQLVGYVDHKRRSIEQCSIAGNWYAVNTEPGQEKLARGEISEAGLITYLPMIAMVEPHGRGRTRVCMRPLLRSYLFVKCQMRDEHWSAVTSARGVHRLLGRDGKPLPISDAELDVIKLCETEKREEAIAREHAQHRIEEAARLAALGGRSGIVWDFGPGERVLIKNGPFASFYAELQSAVDPRDRIKAFLSLFGRVSSVELSAFDVERA